MWASYGALESTLVSTRSTVPGTLASAAASTFAARAPVSACSVLPLTVCRPWLAVATAPDDQDREQRRRRQEGHRRHVARGRCPARVLDHSAWSPGRSRTPEAPTLTFITSGPERDLDMSRASIGGDGSDAPRVNSALGDAHGLVFDVLVIELPAPQDGRCGRRSDERR